MAMRDFFKGGRDRDNDRWREQWRDDRYPQRYSSGTNYEEREERGNQRNQRGPQFYGQSGRADWAGGQDEAMRQRRSRSEGSYADRNARGWNEARAYERNRNEPYHGGFYAGETGRESMYRTEPSGQGDWGRDSQRWDSARWNDDSADQQSRGRDDWRPFESRSQSQSQFQSQGEHRGRGPKGYQRSDQRIHEEVCECLTDDHFIDASNIEIDVQGGIVTLTGTVNSRHEKRRAEDLIETLSGVKDVNNSLRVGGSQSGQPAGQGRTLQARPSSNEQTSRH
jgi:osmotically-inducible protein OsmY